MRKFVRAGAGLAVASLLLLVGPARAASGPSDYSDPAYLEHDTDNMSRSSARQSGEFTSPEYGSAFMFTAAESWLQALGNQVGDVRSGRVHAGAGQLLPGGAVGDPQHYYDLTPIRVQFLSRTGAKLSGRIWGADGSKPKPGIVITTGSIQGTEHMYWWAARSLVAAGYEVFTWDVQGQGESESTGHRFGDPTPTGDGVPSQQAANFTDGTVDALRFFLSTPDNPYVPRPRTAAEVEAAKTAAAANGEHLDWVNPGYGALDHTRLGIAGHSLGASAVSAVQQCSDSGSAWRAAALCQGTAFPIRAVVAWDRLTADGVVPVVPAMDQQADGYFMNPQPAPQSPDPESHLAAERAWENAGLDTYSVTVRGGCHTEWTQIPWISAATSYGTKLADYYTLAWFDRYVKGDKQATQRLLQGPKATAPGTPDPADVAWNAHHFSTRYLGAFRLGGARVTDLRVYAGLSKVGDWAGSNADREGRVIP